MYVYLLTVLFIVSEATSTDQITGKTKNRTPKVAGSPGLECIQIIL